MERALVVLPVAAVLMAGHLAAAEPAAPARPVHTLRLEGKASPPVSIDAIAWLAGRWTGDGLGGVNEEIWSEPRSGTMMGMFRHLKQDRPVFYEFLMIVEEKGSLVMKLKHFNPDFSGWEEKDAFVDFPLVKVEEKAVHFDGLSFRHQDDGSLLIHLLLRDRKGGVREEEFRMKRQP